MLRVAHLLSGDLWAGAEVATYHLLCALARRDDVQVEALLLNEGELADRLRAAGVPTTVERESGRGFFALSRAVSARLAPCDLVHAHRYKENLLAWRSGRAWVATQHGRPEPLEGGAALRMAFYTALDLFAKRRSARRVIAVSGEVESWLDAKLGPGKLVRLWNGIADPAETTPAEPWAKRRMRVGCVGRLVPVKGFELAIDAVARCESLELEIVGDGPDREQLEQRIAASGAADRIRLVGFESNPLPRVATWRALLVTSLHEGNPISVIEALALGTPVLAAELPGVAEMLAGEAGWIVRGREPGVWAKRLQAVLTPSQGGAAASEAARERFTTTFPASLAAERAMEVYRDALGETGAP